MAFDRGAGGSQSGSASITTSPVSVAQGGTGAVTAQDARTNLGLKGMAQQDPTSVSILGGSITGISPPIPIASGGTGASDAAAARTNLGLGSVATQNNTDGISEGSTNLYYTDTRARSAVSASGDLSYNSGTGQFSVTIPVDSVAGRTGDVVLSTSDVSGLGTIATQAANNVNITGGSVTGITDLAIADGGTGASTAANARTNLGLGSIATQSASNVSITGGSVTGITDLAVADGGTGASTSAGALVNLLPSYAGNALRTLAVNSTATGVEWSTAGAGDVIGPASATDGNVVLFDGTTGKLIKAGGALGTAAFSNTGAFATAAQGGKADTALQPTDIGSTVQGYDADLNAIAGISATSGFLKKTAANTWSLDTNTYALDNVVVKLTGDQTVGGTKTFSSTITGSISGNAGTVTNGVYTTGSYADPSWITSLSETKVLPSQTGNNGKYLTTNGTNTSWVTITSGTVTSVDMSVPAGFAISGNPVTSAGTLALSYAVGYALPTTASQTNWDTAYTDRLKWDGGATGLDASVGRTSLGLGTIATQAANNVAITGGSISGITDLAIADGGTGASTAANARVNLLPSYTANAGKVLTVNTGATDVEWALVTGGQFEGTAANKAIMWNAQTIGENITITGTHNAGSFGPITINSGFTVTVNSGAVWTIV